MFKSICIRFVALLVALLASVPALVALLKAIGPAGHRVLLGVPLFKAAMPWISEFRYPMESWADFVSSLPGIISVAISGAGFGVAFRNPKKTVRRWEDAR
jgi:hypothetical protein